MVLLLSVIVVLLLLAAAQAWLFSAFPYHETRNGDTDVSRQLAFILAHPALFAKVFVSWVVDRMPGMIGNGPPVSPVLLSSIPATAPVHSIVQSFPQTVTILSVLGVFASLYVEVFDGRSERLLRWLCLTAALIITFVNRASLYVAFTPLGALRIDGIQPRYFIPQLPLVAIALGGIRRRCQKAEVSRLAIPLLALANILVLCRDILLSFA